MQPRRRLACLLLAAVLCASAMQGLAPANAQEGAAEEKPAAPQVKTLPPAYDPQMLQLSEILGSLHFLRGLCGANEGQLWRDQMNAMIATEEPTEARKAQMIARFNRGYRGFQEVYRECTPSAAEAANRYLRQATRLAAEIPSRFGN